MPWYRMTDFNTETSPELKGEISNAFNSCDRALMLRKLYATPELSPLSRIADFAYSSPSTLLLQRWDDASIESGNGVRQGDPLACLLFCVYMGDLYAELARKDVAEDSGRTLWPCSTSSAARPRSTFLSGRRRTRPRQC
jgi:hypothetical protein